jgi:hypothetical protein
MLSTMTFTDLYTGHLDLYHGWDRVEALNSVSTPTFPQKFEHKYCMVSGREGGHISFFVHVFWYEGAPPVVSFFLELKK